MRNKGFVFVEFLIVTVVTLTFIMGTYYLFFDLLDSYELRAQYNSPDSLYIAHNFNIYINQEYTKEEIETYIGNNYFSDISTCTIFDNLDYCKSLKAINEVENIYLYNLSRFESQLTSDPSALDTEKDKYFQFVKGYITSYGWESNIYVVVKLENGTYGFSPL